MSPYQLGYLVGLFLGGALASVIVGAIVWKLSKSKLASVGTAAIAFVGAMGIGVAQGARSFTSSVSPENRAEFARGFRNGCQETCSGGQPDDGACERFCGCQLDALLARPDANELVEQLGGLRSEADMTPAMRATVEATARGCLPPLYDSRFVASCTSGCGGSADCSSSCACMLRHLREGMDPATGTDWLMHNVEVDPMTPEGSARLEAASAACAPAQAAQAAPKP